MPTTVWQGTVASPFAGASGVTFTLDPQTGAIAQAASSGPIQFTPDPGYTSLTGAFSSTVAFPPDSQPGDPPGAWAAAAAHLVIFDPAKTYTMTITEEDPL